MANKWAGSSGPAPNFPNKTMKNESTEFAKIVNEGESSTKMLAYAFLTAIAAFVVGSILAIVFFVCKVQ